MVKLKLGKMTAQELADWFGINKRTFTDRKHKYLDILEGYAEIEPIYGGVIVKKIYVEEYDKEFDRELLDWVKKEIHRCCIEQNGLFSISGAARKLKVVGDTSSLRKKISKLCKKYYGEYDDFQGGLLGTRKRCWGIKLERPNTYRLMTEEEWTLFTTAVKKHYNIKKDFDIHKIIYMVRDGEFTKDKGYDYIENITLDFFDGVIEKCSAELRKKIVYISKYEENLWTLVQEGDK